MDSKSFTQLKLEQFLQKMNVLAKIRHFVPSRGWIRYFRDSLNISQSQLAKKLNLSQPALHKLEQSELQKSISLNSLQKIADLFDCDVTYAFIPRKNIKSVIENKARKLAIKDLGLVNHTMTLENQQVEQKKLKKRVNTYAKELLLNLEKRLWD